MNTSTAFSKLENIAPHKAAPWGYFEFPDDGVVKPLTAADKDAILAHWLALSPEDLRLRFGYVPSTELLSKFLETSKFQPNEWLGCFDFANKLIAVVHLPVMPEGHTAELGISIAKPRQGQGIGTAFMKDVMLRLQRQGIETLHVQYLRENKAMKTLCSNYDGQFTIEGGDVLHYLKVDEVPAA